MSSRPPARRAWLFPLVACVLLAGALAVAFLFLTKDAERLEIKTQAHPDGHSTTTLVINSVSHGMGLSGTLAKAGIKNPSRLATTYYHHKSPVGLVLERYNWFHGPNEAFQADARLPTSFVAMLAGAAIAEPLPTSALLVLWSEPPIGIIDMGAGTLASYARPMQTVDFYESNPAIKKLSCPTPPDRETFTYIEEALERGANVRVFDGPARDTLAKQGPDGFYRVLVVETARAHPDNPSLDRLTKEAMRLFFSKVTHDGIVCFHVSSRHFALDQVVAALAADLGLACRLGHDDVSRNFPGGGGPSLYFTSAWVMVARDEKWLNILNDPPDRPLSPVPFWSTPPSDRRLAWTDEEQNLSAALRK